MIVDAGFTCPNRDGSKGYGGCTYCNVDSFTPSLPRSLDEIRDQVEQGIARARKHYHAEKFIVYFQPNTNTYAPVERLRELYDEALSVCPEDVVGLSVGTRPDCLDAEKIALLESYATASKWIWNWAWNRSTTRPSDRSTAAARTANSPRCWNPSPHAAQPLRPHDLRLPVGNA